MNDFNSLFPNFASDCAELRRVLLPVAFLFIVIGVLSSGISARRSPSTYMRTVARMLCIVATLALLGTWGNEITQRMDFTVREVLHADPAQVHVQYQQALQAEGAQGSDRSWWDNLFSSEAIFESLISAALFGIGILAGAIQFYAYIVQKFILYLGYAISPIFIGFLAVRTLQSIGNHYLLGLVGVMLWPLGWATASIVTKGLIDFMADQSFLITGGAGGTAGYTLQALLGLAVLGLWIIFSTIAAPVILQKAIASGAQVGQALASGAATAATAGMTSGASAAAGGSAVGGAAARAAFGGIAGAVAGVESSSSGSTHSPAASALGSLGNNAPKSPKPKRDSNDPTRDAEVRRVLKTA